MPKRSGTPSTRSVPSALLVEDAARIVSGDSRRTPSTLAAARDDRLHCGHRSGVAVAVGGAGSRPRRHAFVARRSARRAGGPVNVLTHGLSGSSVARSIGSGGGGITCATRSIVLGRQPDVEVGAERAGDLVGEEPAERPAGDPADHLADQVALVDGVVARRRARLPPRLLRGEQRRRLLPVVEVLLRHRLVPARHARRCGSSGGGPRCRPSRRRRTPASTSATGAYEVELSPRSASIRRHSAVIGLGGRPHVDDRVLAPRRRRASSAQPPQRSTTISPSTSTAMLAPSSSASSRSARMSSMPLLLVGRWVDLGHVVSAPPTGPACRNPPHGHLVAKPGSPQGVGDYLSLGPGPGAAATGPASRRTTWPTAPGHRHGPRWPPRQPRRRRPGRARTRC